MVEADGGGFWDSITDLARSGPSGGGSSNGRYEFSEAELTDLIADLDDLMTVIDEGRTNSSPMVWVDAPGDDPHSKQIAPEMNASGRAYRDSLDGQFNYAQGLRDEMQRTLDSYRGVEQDNADIARQVRAGDGDILEGGI